MTNAEKILFLVKYGMAKVENLCLKFRAAVYKKIGDILDSLNEWLSR
jgi:hypothetical protein